MTETVIGFDLGGTKSAIALYEVGTWKILENESNPTNAHIRFPAVMEHATNLIAKYRRADTVGVGFGIPGLVHHGSGIVQRAPNIPGSEQFPAKKFLEEKIGLPIWVENDARCFALAEARMGAGKGHAVVVGITMGTGVGGGIVIDGELLHGEHGFAGEIGHMLLIPGSPPFPTKDERGDVEQFLSGTSMGKRCEAAKRPEDYLEGEVCSFLRPEVFREVAWMVTSLTHLIDPSIIVFGGSTGRALKPHLKKIEAELAEWLLRDTPTPTLAVAERKDAGTLGAALLTQVF